ncbi:MAG: thiol:disulfide interchange protein DsbA/DsbL [Betaproteobacteria bacterium]|nr:thiol:disulfide interchange protein DsbA/DsbL [Betaproteobacteria bacterium]
MTSRRGFLATAFAVPGFCLAFAAGAAELKEDQDFRAIDPPLAAPKDRIEVTEFFWYGCPHCFDFEPVLAAWVRKLPANVSFRRVPAVTANNRWVPAAQLYYTLEVMNLVEKLHRDVFNAIHVDRQRLDDEKVLLEWVAKKGVDSKKFSEAWSSSGVQGRIQQVRELVPAAGLTGVPAVMVQGRYLVLPQGSHEDMLAIVDRLVARVRTETGAR